MCIRRQKVTHKSFASSIKSILAGVPQGSIFGPLLFLIYINDNAKKLLSSTRLFADDSSLFYAAACLADIAGNINHDLIMLSNWAKQWLIEFNQLKTKTVLLLLRILRLSPRLFLIIPSYNLLKITSIWALLSVATANDTLT